MAKLTRDDVERIVAEAREKKARSNLKEADLRAADLSWANLSETDLSRANLIGAVLSWANLSWANLSWANLRAADLRETTIYSTSFGNVDLSVTKGLKTVEHRGPSPISTSTLTRSKGQIPIEFLRGCGLSDWEIENAKLYNPDLSQHQITDIAATTSPTSSQAPPSPTPPASSATTTKTNPSPKACMTTSKTLECGAGLPRRICAPVM